MTREEGDRIERLTDVVAALSDEVHTLCATTGLEIKHIKDRCDERHGGTALRLSGLEQDERQTYGWRQKLTGMAVPVALCVSVLALVLSFAR